MTGRRVALLTAHLQRGVLDSGITSERDRDAVCRESRWGTIGGQSRRTPESAALCSGAW